MVFLRQISQSPTIFPAESEFPLPCLRIGNKSDIMTDSRSNVGQEWKEGEALLGTAYHTVSTPSPSLPLAL